MNTATDVDITEAIEQSRGGDTQAFARIVRHYQSLVSGVLFSATGDFHQSEDLAQETFLIAWNKLGELREEEHLAAWLCTIARNLAHRSHRNNVVRTVHGSLEGKPTSEPGPDTELLRREQSEMVWSAIGGIEEKYREVLVLFYRSGQSVREIAAATESTEDAVKQRLVRARKSLKVKLEQMIGNVLADTAPGEAFTFSVIVAITGTVVSLNTGTALAGTTAGGAGIVAGSTAATTATTTATGSSGVAAVSMFALPAATIVGSQAISGGMLWAAVRNIPTLRSRRFFVDQMISDAWYLGWFLFGIILFFPLAQEFLPFLNGPLAPAMMQIAVMLLSMPFMVFWSYRRGEQLRQALDHELGLPGSTPRFRTFPEIERQFHRTLTTNILLLETVPLLLFFPYWYSGMLGNVFLFLPMQLIIVGSGVAMLYYYYRLGRTFLDMCRSPESFRNSPPLIADPFAFVLKRQGLFPQFADASSKMAWLNYAPLILMIPAAVFFFPLLDWSKHPVALGFSTALLVGGGFLTLWLLRHAKSQSNGLLVAMGGDLFFIAVVLLFETVQCGGFSLARFVREAQSGQLAHFMSLSMIVLTLGILPDHFILWLMVRRREKRDENAGYGDAVREAITRFDPAKAISDEPVLPPLRFPKRFFAGFVLYGLIVVSMIQLGFRLPSAAGYCAQGEALKNGLVVDSTRQDRLLRAIQKFDAAIAWTPRYAKAFYLRGETWGSLGFDMRMAKKQAEADEYFAKALADCGEAIRLAPRSQEAWETRAYVHWERNDWEAAVADYTESLRFKADAPQQMFHDSARMRILKQRAECEEKLNDYSAAEADLTEAIQVCHDSIYHETTWSRIFDRGDFYARIGDAVKAVADYDEAISLHEKSDKPKDSTYDWLKKKWDEQQEKLDQR